MNQPSLITTNKKWEDVLPQATVPSLLNILDSCRQTTQPLPSSPSLPCLLLFYGAARENKIAAAALMAARLKQEAYSIDLSAVASTYTGETEKNLEAVFAKAENKNWILFFDEADALFGKRTEIKDSHDAYANQKLSWLLQRIEKYKNPVIVAVNDKGQIASSTLRCFHAVIHFPPGE